VELPVPLTAGTSVGPGVGGPSAIDDAVRNGDRGLSYSSSLGGSSDGAVSLDLPNLFEKELKVEVL